MFARLYGIFGFCGEGSRCPAPKASALPLGHTPKCGQYSFFAFFVSGQTCGQTAVIEGFAREYSAEKVNGYKAFRRFLLRDTLGAVSCSQSKRAINCTTPRYVFLREYIEIIAENTLDVKSLSGEK